MVLTVYGHQISPPVRSVLLTCKALGIEYKFQLVDLMSGEHKKPDLMKINPEGTVPFIQDGDFFLSESHAILTYLGDKAGNDSWYPKDIKQRATIQHRLHFDNMMLFGRHKDIVKPIFTENAKEMPPAKVQSLQDSLDLMEGMIHEGGWLAGSKPTIADCCCATSVFHLVAVIPDLTLKPKAAAWLRRCEKELPDFDEINTVYVKQIVDLLSKTLGKKYTS
ncbi:glutathione S-transferase 1-like [Thrips palmi]|uniref:Glutathione S-transferase 1-like n=1 Tax=Thrips palmi TaxID=161013 RepID=A0A6P8XUZ8_THRPL|nr:glutathione S-transferase 1-like [Thrips palmi]XP_034230781.1 glutathione S-transferase 1-like [Thrips palmi]XP_034230782.1 glutathione S-transferase 1-like [Thrips palmi]XP_034230783.1 glutathione S-transferase 1-like [Thrips palmi]